MKYYIMITNFSNHWDKLPGNLTGFTMPMIKFGNRDKTEVKDLSDLYPVIYIKRQQHGLVEKAWVGKASKFEKKPYKQTFRIWFNVIIEREIVCPEKFKSYSESWYLEDFDFEVKNSASRNEQLTDPENENYPLFFNSLSTTNSWIDFEKKGFMLLKLLGINNLHKISQSDNRGKADGFFQFNGLSVLFDFTLDDNFIKTKDIQIENFRQQLLKDDYKHGQKAYTLKNTAKQVWIITRSAKSNLIKKQDGVHIKEISIHSLYELYSNRLVSDMDEDELMERLRLL